MARTVILLLDSFGIGYARDAAAYGDKGADTLGHISDWLAKNQRTAGGEIRPLHLPHLAERGLEAAAELFATAKSSLLRSEQSIASARTPTRRRSAVARIR